MQSIKPDIGEIYKYKSKENVSTPIWIHHKIGFLFTLSWAGIDLRVDCYTTHSNIKHTRCGV